MDRATSRLTLIAHAATEAQRRSAFPADEPVTARSREMLAVLNWHAPRAQHVIAGPELRARETAEALGLAASVDEALRDCDYGKWRGLTMDQVQTDEPESLMLWLIDPAAAEHGGESVDDVLQRVAKWVEALPTGHTVAVTHPAVIRAAVVHALQVPASAFWRIDVSPLSVTDLRRNGTVWTLRSLGCRLSPSVDELSEEGTE